MKAKASTDDVHPPSTIALLGTPRLIRSNGVVIALERKDAALVAMLAMDGSMPRSHAAALLWPDADNTQARRNLRQRLFRHRHTAGHDVIVGAGTLELAVGVTTDLQNLGAQLRSDPQAAPGELLGTLEFGDVESIDQWARSARERWRSTRLELLAQLATECEAQQQLAAALGYAQRMVQDEPLLEHAHRRLMRLHYLRGDRAAALDVYDRCRQVLRHELGMTPAVETTQLAELIERSGALPQTAPLPRSVTTLRPPKLVGRDAAWRVLTDAVDRIGLAVVRGEAGIGKSRLIADFTGRRSGACVVGARPGDARMPYSLLARIVRNLAERFAQAAKKPEGWALLEVARIAPEFGTPAATKLEPLRLLQAVRHLFVTWQGQGLALLAIDDLHFADDATLELVMQLAGSGLLGVGWILSMRAHEVPASLDAWVDDLGQERVAQIAIGPLEERDVEELLHSMEIPDLDAARWAPALMRHTGGNPMFILETLISLADQGMAALEDISEKLPSSVRVGKQIERRLAQLSAPALRLARLAAIAGQDFSADVAAKVLGVHALDLADSWHELETASVIRDNAFAHDLIAEAASRSVPEPVARVLHEQLAAVLGERQAPSGRVAAHWFGARRWTEAGKAYVDAARSAFSRSRRVEEVDYWQRAIDSYTRAAEHEMVFDCRCHSMEARMATQPLDEALDASENLLKGALNDEQRLRGLLAHSSSLLLASRSDDALALAREAMDLAKAKGSQVQEFEAARRMALALSRLGRAEEALALLSAHRVFAEAASLSMQFSFWSDYGPILHGAHRLRESIAAFQRSVDLALQLGDLSEAATCSTNLTGSYMMLGRPLEAHAGAERAHSLRATLGETTGTMAGAVDMNLAACELALGRYGACLSHLDEALAKFGSQAGATWMSVCESHRANVLLQLGQTARATQLLTSHLPGLIPSTQARRLIIEGRIDRAMGRSALPRLNRAIELLSGSNAYMALLAELDAAREMEPATAADVCIRLGDQARQRDYLGAAAKARMLEIDARLRDHADDIDHEATARLAHDLWCCFEECRPHDSYFPEALWIVFRALDRVSSPEASTVLSQARQWVEETALPHVPSAFCDSFLQRNPVNRALLAEAHKRLQ